MTSKKEAVIARSAATKQSPSALVSSRPHIEFALAGLAELFGVTGEFDEQFAGVARLDDLLDPEGLGGAERRTQLFESRFDLGTFGDGVSGGIDLGAVSRLDT